MSLRRNLTIGEGLRYSVRHPLLKKASFMIKEAGGSIGLHPAYRNAFESGYLMSQKQRLEESVGSEVKSVRNHYIRTKYPLTWRHEVRCGFRTASNVGWSGINGFRAGTCWPYKPWDCEKNSPVDIVEIPIVAMDCRFETKDSTLEELERLISDVRQVRGVFTIDYHSNHWDENEFPNIRSIYIDALKYLSNGGCQFVKDEDLINIRAPLKTSV